MTSWTGVHFYFKYVHTEFPISMNMIKAYYHLIFHEINNKPFNKMPFGHSAIKNKYAASSQYAASLDKRCEL